MNGQVPTKEPGRTKMINAALIAAGTIIVTVVTDPPEGVVGWSLFVLGVLVLTAAGAGLAELIAAVLIRLPYERIIAATLVLALAVWVAFVLAPKIPEIRLGSCDPPAQVRVLTSPDLLTAYRSLADEFEESADDSDGSCRRAEVHVFAMPASRAMDGLNAGWSAEYLREGPRPDVWLPESGMHVEEVRKRREVTKFGPAMEVTESLGSSPIVLAVPARTGIKLTDEAWQGQTWRTLADKLHDSGIGLVRPESSTVGDLATIAIYASEDGRVQLRQNPAWARSFEAWVDSSAKAGQYPSGTNIDALLGRQRELGANGAALVLSEVDLVRYNESVRGPSGRGCDSPNGPPACLRAVYPSDTHSFDRPLALLTWSETGQSPAQHDAAVAFRTWLTSTAGGQAAVLQRLRPPPGIPLQAPLSSVNGVVPGGPPVYVRETASPGPGLAEEMTGIEDAVRRTSRVLISLDASGSMRERVGGETRYSLAVKAVLEAHAALAKQAEVSLSVFSATMGVRPVDPGSIGQVQPAGNTPQHKALLEGMRAVGQGGVLVLLTDGTNNVNDVSPAQLAEQTGARVLVLAFGEASCGAQVLIDVTGRTGGSCRQAGVDTLAADLAELLRAV
nr:substrate-binding domain-containing protein [Kibdelosporangium sp. MJ126-NF4]CEL14500.1 von Willebrand factor, type A [Kibdelosporangium sp. MJ126-NF4]CTQ88865.1 von Willebrand factor, type A [Kibdelosporangium sp. MJ126-NF4]